MDGQLKHVYLLSTEEAGDYVFSPSAVVIVTEKYQFTVYSVASSHNLYRAAIHKHSWTDLEKGVNYRDTEFRLRDILDELATHGWTNVKAIPDILTHLYEQNPRHLFFLAKYLTAKPT